MLIAVDGPDGAGKSSQVALLSDWLIGQGVSCQVVSKWDVLDARRHPEAGFLGGTRDQLSACVAQMAAPARTMFILWMYAASAVRAIRLAQASLVILDGFWMKHAAAELAYGADPRLVRAMAEAMPAIDAIFYLDVEPAEALRRKQGKLTRYECGLDPSLDPAKFTDGQRDIRQRLLTWARRDGWRVIQPGSMDQTQQELRSAVWAAIGSAVRHG